VPIPPAITSIYQHRGPFATVYFDATHADERGSAEVELRWRGLRQSLLDAGADPRSVTAIAAKGGAHRDATGRRGQVLVAAADGTLCFDEVLPQPPARELARWAPLPHLVPYLAQRAPDIAYVLVVADRTGADIYAASSEIAAQQRRPEHSVVQGEVSFPLHKTATNDWSEAHFQRRVENSWARNAGDVAAESARQVARVAAELVVIAGDERARALISDDLRRLLPPGVQLDNVAEGGRAPGAAQEPLDEAVRAAVLRQASKQRRQLLESLQEQLGRANRAAAGIEPVLQALQRAQAQTVVLSDDPSSTLTAWIGPEPTQLARERSQLIDLGVRELVEDRLDAAILRAAAESGGDLVITPNAHDYLPNGVAALLRYSDATTVH
jgi:hypothetical protein